MERLTRSARLQHARALLRCVGAAFTRVLLTYWQVRVLALSESLLDYTGDKDEAIASVVAATKAQAELAFT